MATKLPVDQVFRNQLEKVSDFAFNEAVAGVFDDMVSRSVPFYGEMQRMIAELAAYFATEGSNVYDLGCSTGTTLSLLRQTLTGQRALRRHRQFGRDARRVPREARRRSASTRRRAAAGRPRRRASRSRTRRS